MFVQDNTVKSLKSYFQDRLSELYTASEIKLMFQEFLIEYLKISRNDLISADSIRLSESELLLFRGAVKRLLTHEPFQYVLGSTEFYGLELDCDERALIPRPETEELVDWIIKENPQAQQIVDFCTGSGCIALALKSGLPSSTVLAFDISEEALSLAKQNALKTVLEIDFQRVDALSEKPLILDQKLDIVVSNPPYIPTKDQEAMQANVLDFEPPIALFVEDNDPLIFYRKIMEFGNANLKTGGKLYFEIHENFANEMESLMQSMNYTNILVKQDLQGKSRMIVGELN